MMAVHHHPHHHHHHHHHDLDYHQHESALLRSLNDNPSTTSSIDSVHSSPWRYSSTVTSLKDLTLDVVAYAVHTAAVASTQRHVASDSEDDDDDDDDTISTIKSAPAAEAAAAAANATPSENIKRVVGAFVPLFDFRDIPEDLGRLIVDRVVRNFVSTPKENLTFNRDVLTKLLDGGLRLRHLRWIVPGIWATSPIHRRLNNNAAATTSYPKKRPSSSYISTSSSSSSSSSSKPIPRSHDSIDKVLLETDLNDAKTVQLPNQRHHSHYLQENPDHHQRNGSKQQQQRQQQQQQQRLTSAHLVGPPNGRQEEFLNLSFPMFSHLESLTIDYPRLLSIAPIRRLVHLRHLRLRHSQDSWCVPLDLTGLGDLPHLRELDLSHSWIFDFSPISGVASSLRALKLYHTFLRETETVVTGGAGAGAIRDADDDWGPPAAAALNVAADVAPAAAENGGRSAEDVATETVVDTLWLLKRLVHLDMAHDATRPADPRLHRLQLNDILRRRSDVDDDRFDGTVGAGAATTGGATATAPRYQIFLPHLTFLDLSGQRDVVVKQSHLVEFLHLHPHLKHLGLCSRNDDAAFYDVLRQQHQQQPQEQQQQQQQPQEQQQQQQLSLAARCALDVEAVEDDDDDDEEEERMDPTLSSIHLVDSSASTTSKLVPFSRVLPIRRRRRRRRRLAVTGTANLHQMLALLRQPSKHAFMDEVFRSLFEISKESSPWSSKTRLAMDPEVLLASICSALKEARRLQRRLELERHHFCSEGFMIIYDANKVKEFLKTRYNLSINGLACLGNLTQQASTTTMASGNYHPPHHRRSINPNLAREAFEIAYECFEEHFLRRDRIDYCAKCHYRTASDVHFRQNLEGLRELLVKNAASICINLEPLLIRSTTVSRVKMCDILLQPCISDYRWITQDPTLFGLFVTCFNRIFTSLPVASNFAQQQRQHEKRQRQQPQKQQQQQREEQQQREQQQQRQQRRELPPRQTHEPEERETQSLLHADIRDLIRDKIVGAIDENLLSYNPEQKEALLSALWNLTDENQFACQTLVEVGGLEFLVKLMKHVNSTTSSGATSPTSQNDDEGGVETSSERGQDLIRIMGILLNVGLCRNTRKKIEQRGVKKILVQLIEESIGGAGGGGGTSPPRTKNPMLGFLASGILAAIACDDPRKVRTSGFWIFDNSNEVLRKIKLAVKCLNDPFLAGDGHGIGVGVHVAAGNNDDNNDDDHNDGILNGDNDDDNDGNGEIVNEENNNNHELEISLGFTSFKSIFTMLKAGRPPAVHHWALWGVANACGAQPHRHVPMLRREGGFELLHAILKHDKDADVQQLARRLLDFTVDYYEKNQR